MQIYYHEPEGWSNDNDECDAVGKHPPNIISNANAIVPALLHFKQQQQQQIRQNHNLNLRLHSSNTNKICCVYLFLCAIVYLASLCLGSRFFRCYRGRAHSLITTGNVFASQIIFFSSGRFSIFHIHEIALDFSSKYYTHIHASSGLVTVAPAFDDSITYDQLLNQHVFRCHPGDKSCTFQM